MKFTEYSQLVWFVKFTVRWLYIAGSFLLFYSLNLLLGGAGQGREGVSGQDTAPWMPRDMGAEVEGQRLTL